MTTDPSVIRSLAIRAEDLVTAAETTARGEQTAVLRVTPPYSGRMRARLHVVQAAETTDTIHLDPRELLDDDAPPFPTPDETEDDLRTDPDETYTVEGHRQYHESRVETWRDTVLDHVRDSVPLQGTDTTVSVSILGP
jgi:hypothetical protein